MKEALGMIETRGLIGTHVIPSPHDDVESILPTLG